MTCARRQVTWTACPDQAHRIFEKFDDLLATLVIETEKKKPATHNLLL